MGSKTSLTPRNEGSTREAPRKFLYRGEELRLRPQLAVGQTPRGVELALQVDRHIPRGPGQGECVCMGRDRPNQRPSVSTQGRNENRRVLPEQTFKAETRAVPSLAWHQGLPPRTSTHLCSVVSHLRLHPSALHILCPTICRFQTPTALLLYSSSTCYFLCKHLISLIHRPT